MIALAHLGASALSVLPAGFLGLPSVSEVVEAIADGFTQALAGALVPGFLKSATVATIQWLVALPNPGSWTHVSALEGQMSWLGFSLMPVTLTIATIRYWTLGLTGNAHPVSAVGRCIAGCGVLVAYPWIVAQAVAGANTLTHAILGLPEVSNGLSSLVTVLFGGALLSGAGSAFAAVLVIVGVIFAAALFAMQAFLTLLLSVLIVSGPPLIAVGAVPELSHLARGWARALGVVCMIPVCWTVLFAVAGALTLDATDISGGAGGLPGHITAAFAALATWVLAVRLPLLLLGELRGFLTSGFHRSPAAGGAPAAGGSRMPGVDRVRLAQARLRSITFDGVPALAGSAGMAAGALGAPEGGPAGALRRSAGRLAGRASAARRPASATGPATPGTQPARQSGRARGPRARLAEAARIIAQAPGRARVAVKDGVAAEMAAGQGNGRPVTTAGTGMPYEQPPAGERHQTRKRPPRPDTRPDAHAPEPARSKPRPKAPRPQTAGAQRSEHASAPPPDHTRTTPSGGPASKPKRKPAHVGTGTPPDSANAPRGKTPHRESATPAAAPATAKKPSPEAKRPPQDAPAREQAPGNGRTPPAAVKSPMRPSPESAPQPPRQAPDRETPAAGPQLPTARPPAPPAPREHGPKAKP